VFTGLVPLLALWWPPNPANTSTEDLLFAVGCTKYRGYHFISKVRFLPQGERLLSLDENNSLHMWSLKNGDYSSFPKNARARSSWFDVDNSRTLLVCLQEEQHGRLLSRSHKFRLFDLKTEKLIAELPIRLSSVPPAVALSGDASLLIFAVEHDGRFALRVWDVAERRLRFTLAGHKKAITALAISPDQAIVASGDENGIVRMWNLRSGKLLRSVSAHDAQILALCFSPMDAMLVTIGDDNLVRVWTNQGKLLRQLTSQAYSFARIALSPDGRFLASTGAGGNAEVWEVRTGKRVQLLVNSYGLTFVEFSSDASSLVCGTTGLHVFSLKTWKQKDIGPSHILWWSNVAVSPNGRIIATGSRDDTIALWDARNGGFCRKVPAHKGGIRALTFSPDSTRFASAGFDEIIIWDAKDLVRNRRLMFDKANISSLSFSANGTELAAGSDETNRIRVWDLRTGQVIHELLGASKGTPDFWQHGCICYVKDGKLRLVELAGNASEELSVEGEVSIFAVSPDCRLAAVGSHDGIGVWEILTGKRLIDIPMAGPFTGVRFLSDRRTLVVGNQEVISVRDLLANKVVTTLRGPGPIKTFCTFPNGRRLVVGYQDSTGLAWHLPPHRITVPEMSHGGLESCWRNLGSSDAASGLRAVWELTECPEQALSTLGTRVKPVRKPDPREVRKLIAKLGSDQFFVRTRAEVALADFGEFAVKRLQNELRSELVVENRKRLERALGRIRSSVTQQRRAIQTLEYIGGARSERLLRLVADGATDSKVTADARKALKRLKPP
jgi:WD40 repeat protein